MLRSGLPQKMMKGFTVVSCMFVMSSCGEQSVRQVQEYTEDRPAKYQSMPFSFGEVMQAQEREGLCPISISFGSECCGIDNNLRHEFDGYLAEEMRVTQVFVQSWGREGEIDYCLTVPEIENREEVLRQVQSILNNYGEPRRGYAHIVRSAK